MRTRWRDNGLLRSTLFIATAQLVVVGIATPFVLGSTDHGVTGHRLLYAALVAVFAAAGAYLVRTATNDERARVLGALFLLVATAFSSNLLEPSRIASPTLRTIVVATLSLHVEVLSSYFFWRFVASFPRVPTSANAWRWFRRTQLVALALGIAFAVAGFLYDFGKLPAAVWVFSPDSDNTLVFAIQGVFRLSGLAVLARRIRAAPIDERRRASVLMWGIAIGVFPIVAWQMLAPVVPGLASGARLRWLAWPIYPAILSLALTVPYAVVARQALDISVIVRRAVDYAISRYVAVGLLCVPLALLAALIVRHRAEPIAEAVGGAGGITLIVLGLLSVLALRGHRRVLYAIDRAFFREQYDADRIKGDLEHALAEVATPAELARAVIDAIDTGLHSTHCSILLLEQAVQQRLIDPLGAVPSMNVAPRLTAVLSRSRNGLPASILERAADPLHEEERAWLASLHANLIFPVFFFGADLAGLLILGAKQSGLAYGDADRRFVRELLQLTSLASPASQLASRRVQELVYEPARECERCGVVAVHGDEACVVCGGDLAPGVLPAVVAGKFRIEARIGKGGMGVVYRAHDSALDRRVALKTLPQSSSGDAGRLRREARAMAAVVHPHLASIYTLEMSVGRPILVCEYLANGTLADRLKAGPLPACEAIRIGVAIGGALDRLHRSGILHRDIKPSNIGFTETAEPKLLDFGLARILYANDSLSSSSLGDVAGTLRYVSPEVLDGGMPTTDADVWSLSVSLFEAIAGLHPYHGHDLRATLTLALRGSVPDIREFKSDVPAPISEMFRRALSSNPRERPGTATALLSLLSPISSVSTLGMPELTGAPLV